MDTFRLFYTELTKPEFAPPPEVFGVVWSVIYPLIILAGIGLVIYAICGRVSPWLVGLFVANIIANLLFTPLELQFGLWAGTVDILIVLGTLLYLEYKIVSRSLLLFALLVPYTIWVSFATVLQVSLLVLN